MGCVGGGVGLGCEQDYENVESFLEPSVSKDVKELRPNCTILLPASRKVYFLQSLTDIR